MYTKLTLRLNKATVEMAKEYVAKQGFSLSHLVESYFLLLAQKSDKTVSNSDLTISPFVQSMTTTQQISPDLDYTSEYHDYVTKKYE